MALSKSAQAVLWLIKNPDRTPSDAAREFGVHRSTIRRAWARREVGDACPHCGQTLSQGARPGARTKAELAESKG